LEYDILFKKILFIIRQYLARMASQVNQRSVIKNIYTEVGISPGYFLFLTLANLIALAGLITNSAAVIIGAMLISPLMGPILSCGFALIAGDWSIGKKALKKIGLSLVITLIIAAIATYMSPMKDVTDEIISRTRPNLYDLVIAFMAGIAGAIAICTRKNYLTIVPGVAIATAVIPPLSVAGFGIGTWNGYVAGGGFFLFFTNFIAIIFATSLVFYIYGFKPGVVTELGMAQLRQRILILTLSFLIISIPLIYTLHISVAQVRLRSSIQSVLKQEFDIEKYSRLSTFSYIKREDDVMEISAVVNIVDYMKEIELKKIENKIGRYLGYKMILNVEQVLVQTGGLKEGVAAKSPLLPTLVPTKPPADVIKNSREESIGILRKTVDKIERIISPSVVEDFYVGFNYKTSPIIVNLKIKRDVHLSNAERGWLKRIIAEDIRLPVELDVEVVPFFPLFVFDKGEKALSDEMRSTLSGIREIYKRSPASKVIIESYPGAATKKERGLAEERADMIGMVIISDFKVPRENIEKIIHRGTLKQATVKVSVL